MSNPAVNAQIKKKKFDVKLYIEAIRQTKTIGITTVVLMSLFGVIVPLITLANAIINEELGKSPASTINFLTSAPMLPVIMYLFVPIMTLNLFRFLNRRSSSDFYHSIPQTRFCLFTSFSAAIVTWTVATIVISTAATMIAVTAMPKLFIMNYASVLPAMLATLAGSLMVIFATLISMSITGTTFSNVVVAAMILFLPRAFITICVNVISSMGTVFVSGHLFPLLDASYSIPAGIIATIFVSMFGFASSSMISLTTYPPVIYTLVISVIYFVLSSLLFCKRRSETASNPAANKYLQAGCRITFSMMFCIISCLLITTCVCLKEESIRTYFVAIVVLYIIAIIAYFMYELISTRKPKNMLKIFPGLGVLVAVNILLILGMSGIYKHELNYLPAADDISSFSITADGDDEYYSAMTSKISITDRTAIRDIRAGLETSIRISKDGWKNSDQGLKSMTVVIRKGNSEKYRIIYLTAEQYENVLGVVGKADKFTDAYLKLPALGSGVTNVHASDVFASDNSVQDEATEKLYSVLRSELETVDFEKWFPVATGQYDYSSVMAEFYLSITNGTDIYNIDIPLIPSLLPKTAAAYVEAINDAYANSKNTIYDALKSGINESTKGETVDGVTTEKNLYFNCYFSDGSYITVDSAEKAGLMLDFMQSYTGTGNDVIIVTYNVYKYDSESQFYSVEYRYGMNLDKSALPAELFVNDSDDGWYHEGEKPNDFVIVD